jgi:hypothetical protein
VWQVAILGTGRKALEAEVKALNKQLPGVVGVVKFSTPLAHLITAGVSPRSAWLLVPATRATRILCNCITRNAVAVMPTGFASGSCGCATVSLSRRSFSAASRSAVQWRNADVPVHHCALPVRAARWHDAECGVVRGAQAQTSCWCRRGSSRAG